MRPSLPFVAFAAVIATACGTALPGTREPEETATRPAGLERNLTRQSPGAPPLDIASPVELVRAEPEPARTPQPRPPQKAAPAPVPLADPVAQTISWPGVELPPGPAGVVIEVSAELLPEGAGAGRELAPGKTVTLVPASSGPSIEADADDSWLPSERRRGILVGGGGTCRPRSGVRGIGIAGRIPVGFRGRPLR